MQQEVSRLLIAAPRRRCTHVGLFVCLLLLPIAAPIAPAAASTQVQAQDFGIISELHAVLDAQGKVVDTQVVYDSAEGTLTGVRNQVRLSDSSDPLARIDDSLLGTSIQPTAPPVTDHPAPYDILLDPDFTPPGWPETLLGTIWNATDYVVWVHYRAENGGPEHQRFELITFSATLFSLFSTNPLLHEIDVDGDGSEDIRVGLTISWNADDGWGLSSDVPPTSMWVEPTIEWSVEVIDPSDSLWPAMEFLEVALMKQIAYSVNILSGGESYVWVVDSRFTMPPVNFSLEVGFERIWFDIAAVGAEFIGAITGLLPGVNPDDSGIQVAAVAAPYAIHIENSQQADCPDSYNPLLDQDAPSDVHKCTIGVGFGYVHFAPEEDSERDLWELAYIDLAFHPYADQDFLPREIDIVLRNDNLVPGSMSIAGEDSLQTIEYYADERSDLHLHFYEDRSNYTTNPAEPFGNITDSIGWMRGMPSGSMSESEIRRVFRMLGSETYPALPGQMPDRLSLIIGIKNFSKDTSANANDNTLPVNPHSTTAPKTLVVIRSVEQLEQINYTSWFSRSGAAADHRRVLLQLESLPLTIVLYGDFELGGSSEQTILDNSDLDIFSRILDMAILNLVDIFLDLGNLVNSIPEAVVEVISGGGSGDTLGAASQIHIELYDTLQTDRILTPIGLLAMQIGSSPHPVTTGSHLILAKDLDLTKVEGRHAQMDPLVPISFSLAHNGLRAFHFVDNSSGQHISINSTGGNPLRLIYIEHAAGTLQDLSFEVVHLSAQPTSINIDIAGEVMNWSTSTSIGEVLYASADGKQRQVVLLEGLPPQFDMLIGSDVRWTASTPLEALTVQITNSSEPRTMDADHFMFYQNLNTTGASISARLTDISEMGWVAPLKSGATGAEGRGRMHMSGSGQKPFSVAVEDHTTYANRTRGLMGHAQIAPLPAQLAVDIPSGGGAQSSLAIPSLSRGQGVAGVAFFLSGFSELGKSVNSMLGNLSTSLAGSSNGSGDLSFGIRMDADEPFDLTIDMRQGTPAVSAPAWMHGISFAAEEVGSEVAFWSRVWLPGLPPQIELSVEYHNYSRYSQLDLSLEVDGWKPQREELMFTVNGMDQRDFSLVLMGLDTGSALSASLDTQLISEVDRTVPLVTSVTRYNLSQRIDSLHAVILDRGAAQRVEVLVVDIPPQMDIAASIGSVLTIDLSVPEIHRQQGRSVESVMLQMSRYAEGEWWPATMFMHHPPGHVNLSTAPSTVFDITQNLAFQGASTLTYQSSGSGMDLFISSSGRAIDTRGDTLLLAENLPEVMTIAPTEAFGLRIAASGDGVGRLYIRSQDVPTSPGVWMRQMEATGENLKSATVHMYAVAGVYPVVQIEDVRGGRIAATARMEIEAGGISWDARGVLIDAQTTSFVPVGSTVSVNGITSDLSMLNLLPGFNSSTTHYLLPEPMTSLAVTLVATLL